MKLTTLLLCLIVFTSLSSCYTTGRFTVTEIEVLEPAPAFYMPGNRTAAIIYNNSNFMLNPNNSAFILDSIVYHDSINYDSIASIAYYENFVNKLRELEQYDTVYDLGKNFPVVSDSMLNFFTQEECDSLLNGRPADVLYSLNYFLLTDKIYNVAYGEYSTMLTNTSAIWSVYNLKSGNTLTTLLKKDTINYDSDYGSYYLKNFLSDRPSLLNETASLTGENFANYIVPHWSKAERLLYLSGNIEMIKANEYAKQDEWMKAAEIWKKNTKSKNKNIAAKSMFNLALACEMQGDLDAAIDWIVRSIEIYQQKNPLHNENCRGYINTLAKRKIDFKRLKEQVGG